MKLSPPLRVRLLIKKNRRLHHIQCPTLTTTQSSPIWKGRQDREVEGGLKKLQTNAVDRSRDPWLTFRSIGATPRARPLDNQAKKPRGMYRLIQSQSQKINVNCDNSDCEYLPHSLLPREYMSNHHLPGKSISFGPYATFARCIVPSRRENSSNKPPWLFKLTAKFISVLYKEPHGNCGFQLLHGQNIPPTEEPAAPSDYENAFRN